MLIFVFATIGTLTSYMIIQVELENFQSDVLIKPEILSLDLSRIETKNESEFMDDTFGEIRIDYITQFRSNKFDVQLPFTLNLTKMKDSNGGYKAHVRREFKITSKVLSGQNFNHELVLTLMMLKPTLEAYVDVNSYYNIDSSTFFLGKILQPLWNANSMFDLIVIDGQYGVNRDGLDYKYECNLLDSEWYLQLVPQDYIKPHILDKHWNLVYEGEFIDCLHKFNDKNFHNNTYYQLLEEKSKSERMDSLEYYNRYGKEDYYNAMTDGQLGDYNDFNGNIDEIDTWSGG